MGSLVLSGGGGHFFDLFVLLSPVRGEVALHVGFMLLQIRLLACV